jgi:hypothetical protein
MDENRLERSERVSKNGKSKRLAGSSGPRVLVLSKISLSDSHEERTGETSPSRELFGALSNSSVHREDKLDGNAERRLPSKFRRRGLVNKVGGMAPPS